MNYSFGAGTLYAAPPPPWPWPRAKRRVVVELRVRVVKDYPADWGDDMIAFHWTGSSWCVSNALEINARSFVGLTDGSVAPAEGYLDESALGCTCPNLESAAVVREATDADLITYGLLR